MKIALLNDTHFGCRNDSPAFIEYQNKFYNDLFFPYLQQNNIKCLIHLGDVVDRRKFINHNTAHNFKKVFWNRLDELGIDTHIIIGNHDTYYKNTNEVNAMQNLDISKDAKVYTHATTVEFDGLPILFIPWICDDNEAETIRTIENTTSSIAMGHLEIKGFEMHNGHMNEHGTEKSMFKRFEKVMSGHFHKKSDDGHIYYLGTQYEMTWSDYKCPKGFHIFDTETREIERIPNPYTIHEKIFYNDETNDYKDFDYKPYKDKYIKLIVEKKKDYYLFDKFIDGFYKKTNIHDLKVIEDYTDLDASTVADDIAERSEDTPTLLDNYVNELETDLNKEKLKTLMRSLYVEAGDLEI